MLIDFHTHVFPDQLAGRTLGKLEEISGVHPHADGTVKGLTEKMRHWGVDKAVLLHIATKPSQQHTINNWAQSIQNENLFCFGTVHPDAEDAIEELYRIKELGLYGVKLHPDYQNFRINDDRMLPIYEVIRKLKLPVLFHTGWDPVSPDVMHAPVSATAQLLDTFPGLIVIGAHLGGMRQYDQVEELLAGREIYLDLSMSSRFCDLDQYARILKKHGADKLLFASDCPWSDPAAEKVFFDKVDFTPEEREKVYWKNAAKILGLSLR